MRDGVEVFGPPLHVLPEFDEEMKWLRIHCGSTAQ